MNIEHARQLAQEVELPEPRGWQWIDTGVFRKQLPKTAVANAWNSLYTADQMREAIAQALVKHANHIGGAGEMVASESVAATKTWFAGEKIVQQHFTASDLYLTPRRCPKPVGSICNQPECGCPR